MLCAGKTYRRQDGSSLPAIDSYRCYNMAVRFAALPI